MEEREKSEELPVLWLDSLGRKLIGPFSMARDCFAGVSVSCGRPWGYEAAVLNPWGVC